MSAVVAPEFARRVLFVLVVGVVVLFAWWIRDVLLLVFGGVLFAILLNALADQLCRYVGLSRGWALLTTVLGLLILFGLTAMLFGSRIVDQFNQLAETLPNNIGWVRQWLADHGWSKAAAEWARGFDFASAGSSVLSLVNTVVWSTIGAATNLLVVIVAGLYLALHPHRYVNGTLELVPPSRRPRVAQVLKSTENALRQWLLGQLVSMLTIGVLTGTGLWLLGIPSAVALGLIAGIAEFIPIIGPILAAVPAILLALPAGLTQVVYVIAFYVFIQNAEAYLIMPLVQRAMVSLPPVLTLFAVIAFGIIFGPLGVVFATPLTVAALVWVKMLYIQDGLGSETKIPGQS